MHRLPANEHFEHIQQHKLYRRYQHSVHSRQVQLFQHPPHPAFLQEHKKLVEQPSFTRDSCISSSSSPAYSACATRLSSRHASCQLNRSSTALGSLCSSPASLASRWPIFPSCFPLPYHLLSFPAIPSPYIKTPVISKACLTRERRAFPSASPKSWKSQLYVGVNTDAVRRAGGVFFAGGMVAPEALEKVSAELAAAKEDSHA